MPVNLRFWKRLHGTIIRYTSIVWCEYEQFILN